MKRHERHSFSLALHSSFSVMLKKMANSSKRTSEDDHPPHYFPTPSTTARDPLIIPLTDKPVDCEPE